MAAPETLTQKRRSKSSWFMNGLNSISTISKLALLSLATLISNQVAMPASALAAIPFALRSTLMRDFAFNRSHDFSKGLDISAIQPIESSRATKADDISRIIPPNMAPTTNGTAVASQIFDHSISSWFNSAAVRNSSIGHAAHKVEKTLDGDVSFGSAEPESVKHNLRFQMKAAQSQAQIQYSGLTKAQVTYHIAREATEVEVSESVKPFNTNLVYSQFKTPNDRREMLSMRWSW